MIPLKCFHDSRSFHFSLLSPEFVREKKSIKHRIEIDENKSKSSKQHIAILNFPPHSRSMQFNEENEKI